jgi:hypothetical protein
VRCCKQSWGSARLNRVPQAINGFLNQSLQDTHVFRHHLKVPVQRLVLVLHQLTAAYRPRAAMRAAVTSARAAQYATHAARTLAYTHACIHARQARSGVADALLTHPTSEAVRSTAPGEGGASLRRTGRGGQRGRGGEGGVSGAGSGVGGEGESCLVCSGLRCLPRGMPCTRVRAHAHARTQLKAPERGRPLQRGHIELCDVDGLAQPHELC